MSTQTDTEISSELMRRVSSLEEHANARNELLVRIDERTQQLMNTITAFNNNFVRKEEFEPVKKVVYGLVAVVLVAVAGFFLKFN